MIKKIPNAESELHQIINLKFFPEDCENIRLCRLLISKNFTTYVDRIKLLMQQELKMLPMHGMKKTAGSGTIL